MYKAHSDSDLLELIRQSDELALRELRDRYYDRCFTLAYNISRDKQGAQDIITTVFVDLWVKRQSRDITNVSAYVFQMIKYAAYRHCRKTAKIVYVPEEEMPTVVNNEDPAYEYTSRSLLKELEKILAKLPALTNEVLKHRMSGLTNEEIAQKLSISLDKVKKENQKAESTVRSAVLKIANGLISIYLIFF